MAGEGDRGCPRFMATLCERAKIDAITMARRSARDVARRELVASGSRRTAPVRAELGQLCALADIKA